MSDKPTRRQWHSYDRAMGGDGSLLKDLDIGAPRERSNVRRLHPTEWAEQCSVVAWWGKQCGPWGYDARQLFSIPNGAFLAGRAEDRARQVVMLKGAGLRPGLPDLMLAIPRNGDAGLFIEMKTIVGRTDQNQDDYHAILRRHYRVGVCRGADAARALIREYLGKDG